MLIAGQEHGSSRTTTRKTNKTIHWGHGRGRDGGMHVVTSELVDDVFLVAEVNFLPPKRSGHPALAM